MPEEVISRHPEVKRKSPEPSIERGVSLDTPEQAPEEDLSEQELKDLAGEIVSKIQSQYGRDYVWHTFLSDNTVDRLRELGLELQMVLLADRKPYEYITEGPERKKLLAYDVKRLQKEIEPKDLHVKDKGSSINQVQSDATPTMETQADIQPKLGYQELKELAVNKGSYDEAERLLAVQRKNLHSN